MLILLELLFDSRDYLRHDLTSDDLMKMSDIDKIVSAPVDSLTISQYQILARYTDRTPQKGEAGLDFLLLGLFGEVGSLMSELKKKQRDADSYMGYEPSVIEELGDVLWYFSNVASRADINLAKLACKMDGISQSKGNIPNQGSVAFRYMQPTLTLKGPKAPEAFEKTLMHLAGEVGKLVAEYSADSKFMSNPDNLSGHMVSIFKLLTSAATEADINLAQAAHNNLCKIFDRWPFKKIYPPLFDELYNNDEQLPRKISMEIFEKDVAGKTYVFQRCNGIFIGDRLTDNKIEEDDYRFHDIFHLAYAAILGWSPVIRRLFKVKRKSNPKVDDAEDGARAALVEEGISTWIFNHANRLNYFEALSSLDYGLLKSIKEFVSGYEAEHCPLWLWEESIIKGYEIFRLMRERRSGLVTADLIKRTITFKDLPK